MTYFEKFPADHLWIKDFLSPPAGPLVRWAFSCPGLVALFLELAMHQCSSFSFEGTFTSQTDVWAFGVTLWEVFTFARDTPYEHLSDQQVIDNACSVVAKQRKSFRCLPQPQGCPNNVYNILLSCWERSPADRPSFDELCRFFQGMVNTTEECI